jgi:hypothetical protein
MQGRNQGVKHSTRAGEGAILLERDLGIVVAIADEGPEVPRLGAVLPTCQNLDDVLPTPPFASSAAPRPR